jgi:hypothetical protein
MLLQISIANKTDCKMASNCFYNRPSTILLVFLHTMDWEMLILWLPTTKKRWLPIRDVLKSIEKIINLTMDLAIVLNLSRSLNKRSSAMKRLYNWRLATMCLIMESEIS